MTEDKDNYKEKTSMKRSPKDRHIDVRFTEDEFNRVLKNAQLSGRSKSIYLHDVALGHKPSLPMTAEEQEALRNGATSETISSIGYDSKSNSNSTWSGNDQLRNKEQSCGHRQNQSS